MTFLFHLIDKTTQTICALCCTKLLSEQRDAALEPTGKDDARKKKCLEISRSLEMKTLCM